MQRDGPQIWIPFEHERLQSRGRVSKTTFSQMLRPILTMNTNVKSDVTIGLELRLPTAENWQSGDCLRGEGRVPGLEQQSRPR
jgi:hypothetical protein